MKIQLEERIPASVDREELLAELRAQLPKIAEKVDDRGEEFVAHQVDTTWGSVNRTDRTRIWVESGKGGHRIRGEVRYQPSVMMWIFVLTGLTTAVGWLIPLMLYDSQKKRVQSAIDEFFGRVKTNVGSAPASAPRVEISATEELERLAALRDKGVVTDEELQAKKKELLHV